MPALPDCGLWAEQQSLSEIEFSPSWVGMLPSGPYQADLLLPILLCILSKAMYRRGNLWGSTTCSKGENAGPLTRKAKQKEKSNILLTYFIICRFIFGHPHSIWKFSSQWSNQSWSCKYARSLTYCGAGDLTWASTVTWATGMTLDP